MSVDFSFCFDFSRVCIDHAYIPEEHVARIMKLMFEIQIKVPLLKTGGIDCLIPYPRGKTLQFVVWLLMKP